MCGGAESWAVLGSGQLDCPDGAAVQAAPSARPCLASSEVLSTSPCLASADNAPRQPLLPFASWREVRAQTNPLPTACRLPRVVWNIPLEKSCLQLLCQNMSSMLIGSVLGISPRLNFGPALGKGVQQTPDCSNTAASPREQALQVCFQAGRGQ